MPNIAANQLPVAHCPRTTSGILADCVTTIDVLFDYSHRAKPSRVKPQTQSTSAGKQLKRSHSLKNTSIVAPARQDFAFRTPRPQGPTSLPFGETCYWPYLLIGCLRALIPRNLGGSLVALPAYTSPSDACARNTHVRKSPSSAAERLNRAYPATSSHAAGNEIPSNGRLGGQSAQAQYRFHGLEPSFGFFPAESMCQPSNVYVTWPNHHHPRRSSGGWPTSDKLRRNRVPHISILRCGIRAPREPLPPIYAAPTTITRATPSSAGCGRISITTSCSSAVAPVRMPIHQPQACA
jgi:hypothetical protein